MLFSVFGVSVTVNNPTLITSTADTCCGLDDDGITEEDLDNWCTLSGDCNTTHHRSISYVTRSFRAWRKIQEGDDEGPIDMEEKQDIYLLMSGYSLCSIDGSGVHKNDYTSGVTESGVFTTTTKLFDPSCVIAVPFEEGYDEEKLMRSIYTTVHEESHALGANENVDDKHSASDKWCIMSYGNNGNLLTWRILNHQYDSVYCDSCEMQINNYLDTYY